MVFRPSRFDPAFDPAAPAVLAAFTAAEQAGLPRVNCYRAGVEAWHRAHPDQTREYVARQAVSLILEATVSLRIADA